MGEKGRMGSSKDSGRRASFELETYKEFNKYEE